MPLCHPRKRDNDYIVTFSEQVEKETMKRDNDGNAGKEGNRVPLETII